MNSISDRDNLSPLSVLGVYDHHGFSANSAVGQNTGPQHRTHEGYLRKRGHLLKQWKERWFVLDSVRHEVIHPDELRKASSIHPHRFSYAITTASDDQTAKGVILLADAVEILPYTGPFPNALRRFDSRAAFEVRDIHFDHRCLFTFFHCSSYIPIVAFTISLQQLLKMLKHGRKRSNRVSWILKIHSSVLLFVFCCVCLYLCVCVCVQYLSLVIHGS